MSAGRRVVHHIPSMRHGGAERQLSYLAGGLRTAGWDVHVIVSDGGANLARLQASGATVHELHAAGAYDPRTLLDTIRLLRALRPNVVQTWLTRSDIVGGMAARWNGIPWILNERSSAGAYPRHWQTSLRARLATRASAIVSNSAGGDAFWAARLHDRIPRFIVGNAVPLVEIDAEPQPPRSSEPLVMYAGRLSPEKNVDMLAPALALALETTRFRALICGDGPRRAAMEAAIASHDLADHVQMIAELPTVWGCMKAAQVFVSLSAFEGSSNTVLEAMACGCTLVLSDTPAHREQAGEAAIYVDASSTESVAAGVRAALCDARRDDRIRAGRAIAEAATPMRQATKLTEVYDRVLAGASA